MKASRISGGNFMKATIAMALLVVSVDVSFKKKFGTWLERQADFIASTGK
jgi:hypothetical protein